MSVQVSVFFFYLFRKGHLHESLTAGCTTHGMRFSWCFPSFHGMNKTSGKSTTFGCFIRQTFKFQKILCWQAEIHLVSFLSFLPPIVSQHIDTFRSDTQIVVILSTTLHIYFYFFRLPFRFFIFTCVVFFSSCHCRNVSVLNNDSLNHKRNEITIHWRRVVDADVLINATKLLVIMLFCILPVKQMEWLEREFLSTTGFRYCFE